MPTRFARTTVGLTIAGVAIYAAILLLPSEYVGPQGYRTMWSYTEGSYGHVAVLATFASLAVPLAAAWFVARGRPLVGGGALLALAALGTVRGIGNLFYDLSIAELVKQAGYPSAPGTAPSFLYVGAALLACAAFARAGLIAIRQGASRPEAASTGQVTSGAGGFPPLASPVPGRPDAGS